jgi:hypothetical protein
MDLFNAKALAAAQSRCAALERELTQVKLDLFMCKSAIRRMDDAIFSISQCTDFTTMRPHVQLLVSQMEHRRQAESNRITSIINEELHT